MKKTILSIAVITLLLLSCKRETKKDNESVKYDTDQFVMGVDLSYVNQILDFGGVYRDSGKIEDPYRIFSEYGANVVRLRLWHNPVWTRDIYGGEATDFYNDFNDVALAIDRSKQNGMKVCLDFHYSDNWADPQKQVPPAVWQNLALADLRDSLYNYTLSTLEKLNDMGLMPEYVQVGNEINPGLLLPDGERWNNNEENFVTLLNGAIDGVRDAAVGKTISPQIIVHIAQPDNAFNWLTGLADLGLHDFDIIGLSYYYIWSDVLIDQVSDRIRELKNGYGKDVMVVETAYPFTTDNADSYNNIIDTGKILTRDYPATIQGQYDYMVALTQEIIDGGGKGIMYWEPAWITSPIKTQWSTGSAWDCNTLFSFSGDVIKSMEYMTVKYNF